MEPLTIPIQQLSQMEEIAQILANGFIRLQSQKNSTPDRSKPQKMDQKERSNPKLNLDILPLRVMNGKTESHGGQNEKTNPLP